MSTKTTIKRLALVTVAALGLGVLTVAPSSAAVQADTMTLSSATASTTVGTAVTTSVTVGFIQETTSDSMTVALTYEAAPAGIAINEVTFTNTAIAAATDLGTPVVDTTTANSRLAKISTAAAASVSKTMTITLTPSKAGTYVIRVTPGHLPSGTPVATAKTWTVTVAAKTVGSRSAFLGVTGTLATDTQTADAAATSLAFDAKAATGAKARLDVAQMYGATGNDTASSADGGAVVVTIDKGLVSKTNDYTAGAASVTTAAATAGAGDKASYPYWIFANGTVGTATITITVGGVALTSKTVVFKGAATTLVATKGTASTDSTFIAVGTTNSTVAITATDSAGGAAQALPTTMTVTSSDTSVATATIASGTVTISGLKAGTATLTIKDSATTSPAASATYAVTVKAVRPTTAPTITFDKPSYNVGDVVEMTVNADMADSATVSGLFTTALVTSATTTAVPGATGIPTANANHAIVGGKAIYKFYAPAVSGSFTVTGTTGGTVDITTAVPVTATVTIDNPAVAAAELAEAAAQDATDAALEASEDAKLAVELAQQAVDAVADLSAQVTTLIAALKKQITTLTNLVKKIAAKK